MNQSARFLKWGVESKSSRPCLTMVVVPDGRGQQPVAITVPNQKSRSRSVNPPAAVERLAGSLKVGDRVRVSYDKFYSRRTYKSASRAGASSSTSGGQGNLTTFTFTSLRKVRHGGSYHAAVTAGKGNISWTFLLPNVPGGEPMGGASSTSARRAAANDPTPDAKLLAEVKKYRRGDPVRLTYEPYKYVFAMKDIQPVQLSASGIVRLNKQMTRSDKPYRLLHVLQMRRNLVLLLPLADPKSPDQGAKGDADLIAAVEAIKPRQKVNCKYHKQGGLYILDEIAVQ